MNFFYLRRNHRAREITISKNGEHHFRRYLFNVCLIAFFLTGIISVANAQSVSLSFNNAPLKKVLDEIKQQSGYELWYNTKVLKKAKPVSVNFNKADLKTALDKIFKDQPLSFEIVGKTIVVKETPKAGNAFTPKEYEVNGEIKDNTGKPLNGATVKVKDGYQIVSSDSLGRFKIAGITGPAKLIITSLGYEPLELAVDEGSGNIHIQLAEAVSTLQEVKIVSNGFQKVSIEKTTGSFVKLDSVALNRRVSTNILERLEGITSGMLLNNNPVGAGIRSNISIRGMSTIYANDKPLIVLDNFEYTGDISNINPNDIESITILKDASAASIWGAKSGNGVIVLTTKKGSLNEGPKISVNSNVTIGEKPDLFYNRQLSPSEYIDVENFLFSKGYYDNNISSDQRPGLSPAVELMLKNRNNEINAAELQARLEELGKHDVRSDFQKYLFQNSVSQQHAISIKGGGNKQRYYLSGGFDRTLPSLAENSSNRVTLNANSTVYLLKNKLELATSLYFTHTQNSLANRGTEAVRSLGGLLLYPYAKLADENGNSLPVAQLRQGYIDTAGGGRLLDWRYRPLDEIKIADNKTNNTNYLLNLGLAYKVVEGMDLSLQYQYDNGSGTGRNLQGIDSYYTRNYINQFSKINSTTGAVTRPVPLGAILDAVNTTNSNQRFRVQADFRRTFGSDHEVAVLAGYEISTADIDRQNNRFYGYNDELATQANVDYLTFFPYYYGTTRQQIIAGNSLYSATERYRSVFSNASYTYLQRYSISGSIRKDESNLFGVNTNQKGVPLWSMGLKWHIDKEPFYNLPQVNYLKFRATYGYNGNIDKSVTAYLTGATLPSNAWGVPYLLITNPPNTSLRWERVNIINLGLDYGLFKDRINGSFEYYLKRGMDLMGDATLAPSSGMSSYRGNSANIRGNGVEVSLNSKNLTGALSWETRILYNHSTTKVTEYLVPSTTVSAYVVGGNTSPIKGRPLFAIYSYKWAGLSSTGDPQGILDGAVSTNWNGIASSGNLDNMVYNGPANPTSYGSIMNSFSYKGFNLSFNIIYKLGYYFKRPSVDYSKLYGLLSLGDPDYSLRWQKPGDELTTNVPSSIYPTNLARDSFYQNASILVEKGDHLRFQDIQFGYTIKGRSMPIGLKVIRLYAYLNNLGIIWRANKYKIDPDFAGMPNPRTYALGMNVEF